MTASEAPLAGVRVDRRVMPVFDADWRYACSVRKCSITEVDAFIRAHYLAKRPAIVLLCLVAERNGEPIGCIVYSAPPR